MENREYRMLEYYKSTVVPALIKKFNYKNVNQVPKIEKVVLNMGLGDVKDNSKSLQQAIEELKLIAGQAPAECKAKKSVALCGSLTCDQLEYFNCLLKALAIVLNVAETHVENNFLNLRNLVYVLVAKLFNQCRNYC